MGFWCGYGIKLHRPAGTVRRTGQAAVEGKGRSQRPKASDQVGLGAPRPRDAGEGKYNFQGQTTAF